ncbi:hypothetical protein ADK86_31435 [Streptomyces sp. NRRL F-5755]|nr:hypothetical protein ADK86_31435 [Streptomyces sp. NRRL F-5755]
MAERGLDVLLLEAGPRHAHPREEWTHYENDANHPLTGFFRFGPADRAKSAWFRETPQSSFVMQLSGVGGTTQHYFANSPRAYPGAFSGYSGPDAGAYDTRHRFPFPYAELVPYYEWVEATLPVQTAAMGTKEEVYFQGCETLGIPVQTALTTTGDSYRPQQNAILQPGGHAGRTADPRLLIFPRSTGCTFCGHCSQGCMQPVRAPRNQFAKRSTDNSYVPMALTADVWSPGGRAAELITDAFVTRIHTEAGAATGVTWRNREFLARKATALLRGAGARTVLRVDMFPVPLHVQSSLRTGLDPRTSVLDADCRSRAVDRLYVADNSALANSLGGPNPTLTTQALAARTAERVFTRVFGGDPWVRTGAPVVSTDLRVSRRLAELGL